MSQYHFIQKEKMEHTNLYANPRKPPSTSKSILRLNIDRTVPEALTSLARRAVYGETYVMIHAKKVQLSNATPVIITATNVACVDTVAKKLRSNASKTKKIVMI